MIPRDTLLSVLRREDALRMCEPVQSLYDEYKLPPPSIEAELQRIALTEHHLCRCWLPAYWQTAVRWPAGADDAIRQATVWLRVFERTRPGTVLVGAPVPPVALLHLDSDRPTTLLAASAGPSRPLVAVAGSGS